jgi:hypothetical protein
MVDPVKYGRVGLEVHVKYCVHKGQIQATAQHNSFGEKHPHRSCEHDGDHLLQVAMLEFERRKYVRVVVLLAETSCTCGKDNRCIGFRAIQQDGPCAASYDQ